MNDESTRPWLVPSVIVMIALVLSVFLFLRGPYTQHHHLTQQISQLSGNTTVTPVPIAATAKSRAAAQRALAAQTTKEIRQQVVRAARLSQVVVSAASTIASTTASTTATTIAPIVVPTGPSIRDNVTGSPLAINKFFLTLNNQTQIVQQQLVSQGPLLIVSAFTIQKQPNGSVIASFTVSSAQSSS